MSSQAIVKRHERSACDLANRKQITITKRLRRRQPGNRPGCRAEVRFKLERLMPDSDSRILKPSVVHLPCFTDSKQIFAPWRGG